jgi:hypothetical protein
LHFRAVARIGSEQNGQSFVAAGAGAADVRGSGVVRGGDCVTASGWDAAGTLIGDRHFGHGSGRPAAVSGAFSFTPQEGHETVTGTVFSRKKRSDDRSRLPNRPGQGLYGKRTPDRRPFRGAAQASLP